MIIKSRKIVALLTIAGIVVSLVGISAITTSSDQDIFFDSIKAQCGNAFAGSVEDSSNSTAYNGRKFVLHIRDCSDHQIKMPLHIDDNSSRILVLSKTDGRIKLQHDHRHADGSSEALTLSIYPEKK